MFAVLHPAIGFHTSQILSIRSIESLRVVPNQQGDKAEGLELVFVYKKVFEKTLHRFANGSYYFPIEDVSQ